MMQNAIHPQTTSDKARIMLAELGRHSASKTEVIDRTYIKCGCVPSQDGTRVCCPSSLCLSAGYK